MPGSCENWVSTPGPKRITLESFYMTKLSIEYAYCLEVYLPNQNCRFQVCSISFVRAANFDVRISSTLCERYRSIRLMPTLAMNFICVLKELTYMYIGWS